MPVDEIALNFTPSSLMVLNIILAIVMFGVALDLKTGDFRAVLDLPRSAIVGLTSQFLILPALTFLLSLLVAPTPSMALGMILVAACPGGNMSNFYTHLGKGNTPLSISMSAVSTAAAIFMTPLNLAFWGSLHPEASAILREVAVDPVQMVVIIFLLLGLPLSLGLLVSHQLPHIAAKLKGPMKYFSIAIFGLFIVLALAANFENFITHIGAVFFVVLLHNGIALLLGYYGARALRLPERDRRAVAIEVGIQNSGLGLVLIFNFFNGLGGMAIVAAWWGVWHLISGLTLALFWSRREPAGVPLPAAAD